ncbi:MAG TPA: hypothetical protein VG435_17305 [Acidimicrobiales bacterium]|nr:hypothetical protein [Acidimicrobiales bacterium]
MPGTLQLTRGTSFAFELRRGTFDVVLDGTEVAQIDNGGRLEKTVEPGPHTLEIRRGRYSSRPHDFECRDEEVVSFRCHGAAIWPRYVVSLAKPDLAISLRRE